MIIHAPIRVSVSARDESWPITGSFAIARGSKTSAEVVVVTVSDGERSGTGECVPYPRYGESVSQTLRQIRAFSARTTNLDHHSLLHSMPPGAGRNALDCALWDLMARRARRPVWDLAGLCQPRPVVTAFTLSLDSPAQMRARAEAHATLPLLKIKLGSDNTLLDLQRLRAVRDGAPGARLIVDANEGWSFEQLREIAPAAADVGVEMIEQPLPADGDAVLAGYDSPVPLGADESVRADTDLRDLAKRYQIANIKLDKTGGLTHAIDMQHQADQLGLEVMIGCMVATSWSMAPALLLDQTARVVDLDGPLLLERDRQPGLLFTDGEVAFPNGACWGSG